MPSPRRRGQAPASPPCLPAPIQAEARALCLERVTLAVPHLTADAAALLDRLPPRRWALEWSLPYWLGQAFVLPAETALRLVVSNLLGLGFVRLQDDLVDGEIPALADPASRATALLLSASLQHLWIASLRELCGADPHFWGAFDTFQAQWHAATWASLPAAAPSGPPDLALLGQRGAPLKVCVAAACLLAGQPQQVERLTDAVDDILIAAVLLDQAMDWEDDVRSGRPNAFASFVLSGASGGPTPTHRAVSAALLAGTGAGSYFATARRRLASAETKAREVGLSDLEAYVQWLDAQAAALQRDLRRRVRAIHEAAGAQLRAAQPGDARG